MDPPPPQRDPSPSGSSQVPSTPPIPKAPPHPLWLPRARPKARSNSDDASISDDPSITKPPPSPNTYPRSDIPSVPNASSILTTRPIPNAPPHPLWPPYTRVPSSSRSTSSSSSAPKDLGDTTTMKTMSTQPDAMNLLQLQLSPRPHYRPGVHPFAGETDNYADWLSQYGQPKLPSKVPENCWTFCTQQSDNIPLCRMFCIRSGKAWSKRRQPERSHYQSSNTTTPSSWGWRRALDSLQDWADSRSFVYLKGPFDSTMAKYVKEMEKDNETHTFQELSRVLPPETKPSQLEERSIRWGMSGSPSNGFILHVPFTAIFYPILALPKNLDRIFSPGIRFMTRYQESFEDGTQTRFIQRFIDKIQTGGASEILGSVADYWSKKIKEQKEVLDKLEKAKTGKVEKGD